MRLRQIRGRSSEDLVLLLEETDALVRFPQLFGLRRGRHRVGRRGFTTVDAGALESLLQRDGVNAEVRRDLLDRDAGLTVFRDAHGVVAEPLRVGSGHGVILPGAPRGHAI